MKRKIAALLMGTTLSVAVCGYSVQAMTYGYDMGGKVFISEDSSSSNPVSYTHLRAHET